MILEIIAGIEVFILGFLIGAISHAEYLRSQDKKRHKMLETMERMAKLLEDEDKPRVSPIKITDLK